eukprot:jgi/Ulvmu1/4224/UM019_0203.1
MPPRRNRCKARSQMTNQLETSGAGPNFFNLGALFATGEGIDRPRILEHGEPWASKPRNIMLQSENEISAASKSFHLSLLTDRHTQRGRIQQHPHDRIPNYMALDAPHWPANEYLTRWLEAGYMCSVALFRAA